MGGASFLFLSSVCLAVTVQAQSCSRPVGSDMTLRDQYITLREFPDGITVSFVCNIGYESAGGSAKITCTMGAWSTLSLRCTRKSCGSPGDVQNGNIDFSEGVEFGARVNVTCKEGYRLSGSDYLICGDQGWLNRLPTCEVINCDPPSKILNGTFAPVKDSYAYTEVVTYKCIEDNTVNGSKVLSCSDNGQFKPAPPKCTYVECPEVDIKNAEWKDGSRPPYKYKSSVTYECQRGYSMQGHHTVICDINSQWSPGLPKCIPIELTTKATTTTTPAAVTPDSHTPRTTPGSGGDSSSHILYGVIAVGVACAAGIGVYVFYRHKKRKQISHHENEAANKGGEELRPLDDSTAINLKTDEVEDMNSAP